MRILIASDFHGHAEWYQWLGEVGSRYDAIALAGDHLRHWRRGERVRAGAREVEKCIERLEGDGVQVWLGESSDDRQKWPWLRKRLGHHSTQHAVAYSQPCGIAQSVLRGACMMGNDLADQRRVPFVVVCHQPPSLTPVPCLALQQPDMLEHAAYYQPDYCFTGHIHNAPFENNRSQEQWYRKIGRTWVFNPGSTAGSFPSHVVVDTETREAHLVTSIKIKSLNLDKPRGAM